ncbi:MAG: CotH kinase family protein, partial [Candidatus Krumholzibacteria bacterium]|nr:CotH kinase family protein [Candidatus Krumholzibacteria bacterium]
MHFPGKPVLFLLAISLIAPLGHAQLAPTDYFLSCDPDSFQFIYDNYWLDHYIPCTMGINGVTWPDCRMRIRGDSSREFPKKSLRIKSDGAAFPNGRDVMLMNADWYDRSYMRTVLASRLFQ